MLTEPSGKRAVAFVDGQNLYHAARQALPLMERNMRMKHPPHPGDFIKTEIIEPLGISVTEAAKALGVSRPTLSTLLSSHADVSPEMALRLEKAFGISMELLIRMQASYDAAQMRLREDSVRVRRYRGVEANP